MRFMKFLFAIGIIISCSSCGGDTNSDTAISSVENIIEAKAGEKVELGTTDSYENNSGSVSFESDGKIIVDKEVKMQAIAMFTKENEALSIVFQFSDGNGKALMATISHIPNDFEIPLIAKFALSNAYDGITPVATMMFMNARENSIGVAPVPFEGTLTVTTLTANEMTFVVDGKGGTPEQAESPSTWKPIKASGLLQSPIIQTFGIDQKDVLR